MRIAFIDSDKRCVQIQDGRGIPWIEHVLQRCVNDGKAIDLTGKETPAIGDKWNGEKFEEQQPQGE